MGLFSRNESLQHQFGEKCDTIHINVGKDFSRFPAGRYPDDGPGNASDFRDKHLLPVLKNNQKAVIEMDDAVGYPASFLDEAFGGLVKEYGYDADTILNTFEFNASSYEIAIIIPLIEEYVRSAHEARNLAQALLDFRS